MIPRHLEPKIKEAVNHYPVITLTGPRQSGKTTLAKTAFSNYTYLSLEDPETRLFAERDPKAFFKRYSDHIIIDEAQKIPDIFSYIQTLVDNEPIDGRFILTGSEQFLMDQNISQSLAGRAAIFKLLPFSLSEILGWNPNRYWRGGKLRETPLRKDDPHNVIYRGFYPRIHDKNLDPSRWYGEYFETYVSRDVRQLLNIGDLRTFELFVRLLAGRSGQILNLSSLGSDAGITHTTAKRWLSIMQASYIVDLLPPYFNNFGKRIVKSPKVYFLDCGFLCSLLNIRSGDDIITHPLRGQIFETYAYSEIVKSFTHAGERPPLYFWQGSQKMEIDIVIDLGSGLRGVEIKSGSTINSDSFKNLLSWSRMTKTPPSQTALIYGGGQCLTSNEIQIIPWYGIG